MSFEILKKSEVSKARAGKLNTNHGEIPTPFFMPIATAGAVKTVSSIEMEELGASIILSNTYHLMLKPGMDVIGKAGGLHNFMNWQKPILTDSGGYQVFSLAEIRKIHEDGVTFRSSYDGSLQFLSPEKSVEIQKIIGSDIVMVLDECTEYPVTEELARKSMEMTTRWAARGKAYYNKVGGSGLLFGIVQGSTFSNLRKESAKSLVDIGFDGYAIGGLSIGEARDETYKLVELQTEILPEFAPRYFMGAGKPEEIVEYVRSGIDMFDCVIPTRNARHGMLYVAKRPFNPVKIDFYDTIHITNEKYKDDFSSIDSGCGCFSCKNYSRAYICHLFRVGEPLGACLASIHNLYFYIELMAKIREAISAGIL